MFWELLFPVLEPWAGEPGVELGLLGLGTLSAAKISFPFVNHHLMGVGPACSASVHLLSVLLCRLLYILSYRIPVQLVFRWLLMVVVP